MVLLRSVSQAINGWNGAGLLFWVALSLSPLAASAAESQDVEGLLTETRQQLDQVRTLAADLLVQLQDLRSALEAAEGRNQAQNKRIAELEQQLTEIQQADPGTQAELEAAFFGQLSNALGPTPVIDVGEKQVRIASDQIFVFGTGELGAEGRRRLAPLTVALLEALALLPEQGGWRLRVEGHTDSRALKSNARFASNWELSAARAVAVLRYLKQRGVPEQRLLAVGYAASRRQDEATDKAAHRRNRRVEIRLEFDDLAIPAGG